MSGGTRSSVMGRAFNSPASAPPGNVRRMRQPHGQPAIPPERAKQDSRQAHRGPNGEVDAAGDDHRRERQREQTQLHAQPDHLEQIAAGKEVSSGGAEERYLQQQDQAQQALLSTWRRHSLGREPPPRRSDGPQNDHALNRFLPEGIDAQECERGPITPSRCHAQQRAPERSASPVDRRFRPRPRRQSLSARSRRLSWSGSR